MAKKTRTTKRSTRPKTKRKPKTKVTRGRIVSASGRASRTSRALGVGAAKVAGTGNAAGTGTATAIAARQREFPVAVQSTIGGVDPPVALRAGEPPSAGLGLSSSVKVDGDFVLPAPIPITPTVYPDSSQGTVIVQNHVTINIYSAEFVRFSNNIEALISELRQSNEISGEVRDKLLSELKAGKEIITAPKPQRGLIDLFLVTPLKWIFEKSGSAIISKLAGDALEWLLRML